MLVQLQQLIRDIEELRISAEHQILGGRVADFSEYRYSAGYLKGLTDATTIITTLIEKLQQGN